MKILLLMLCLYTQHFTVTETVEDIVICVDDTGNEWAFYGDGYSRGDEISALMNTNGTFNNIYDDSFIIIARR